MANYKDGIIRDGRIKGTGKVLGNIKEGIVRESSSSVKGTGKVVGNIKDDIIRESSSSVKGTGKIILNLKDGVVRKSSSSVRGTGSKIDKVDAFMIDGMERELDSEIVAAYHFLIKKIV